MTSLKTPPRMDATSGKTQHGYLVLADISGYTSFVAATELEHSQEILTELLELIVGRFQPLLAISKLEGDAVFGYAPDAKVPRGETLLELVESTYLAFRDRREAAHRRTTCTCNACRAIPTLDLKFIVHHGDYIAQRVSGIHELIGSDVNLIHRLLKNHVAEATGWRAYALFTEAALACMGVRPAGMHAQAESYEHLGEVQAHSLDLYARYKELTDARRMFVSPDEADLALTLEYPAPPPVVWEWLNDPQRRTQVSPHTRWRAGERPGGRTGAGVRNHCAHGQGESVETILDWRPFEYVTAEHVEGKLIMTDTHHLEPIAGGSGTRLRYYARAKAPGPRFLVRPVFRFLMLKVFRTEKLYADLGRCLAEEMAREPEVGEDRRNGV